MTPGPEIEIDEVHVALGRREQCHPAALAEAEQPDRLAAARRMCAQNRQGGEGFVGAVLECLLQPVARRAAAPGLVMGEHDRAAAREALRPLAPVIAGAVAGAVDDHDSGQRTGRVGDPRERAQVAGGGRD